MSAVRAAGGVELRSAAFRGLTLLLAALAVLIFLPAWSVTYWRGLLYWLVFAASSTAITLYFLRRDPELIGRRLDAGAGAQRERTQKIIQAVASVCFIATVALPAFDHLFHWSSVPGWVSIAADVIAALGFYGVFLTFRENGFASATIQVDPDQPVVASGPYAVAPSDVRDGGADDSRHAAGAGLVVGIDPRAAADRRDRRAPPRRGALPDPQSSGLRTLPSADPFPPRARGLVAPRPGQLSPGALALRATYLMD
jgi:hypothetical protein